MCTLESERLILRAPRPTDIAGIVVWLGDFNVARNMSRVPHPYHEEDAEMFVAGMGPHGEGKRFSVLRKSDGVFMGCAGFQQGRDGLEFGYWLGTPFWGQGFATEAASRLVAHAFEEMEQDSVHAGWFYDNPASGHVLAKLGARHNGSRMRECRARGMEILCHDMLLTRADFLRKQAH
jgi:ribosomal-protein-alanine N-acetyltransferase